MLEQNNDIAESPVLATTRTEFLTQLFTRYSNSVKEAEAATDQALQKLEQNFQTLKNNRVALTAQKQLLASLEKDLQNWPS